MLVLTLGTILFRSEVTAIPLGVVIEDQGIVSPIMGELQLGQRIADVIAVSDTFNLVELNR